MTHRLRTVALFALIVAMFALIMPVSTVQAQPLNRWCKSVGGTQQGSTCTIPKDHDAQVKRSLDVPPGLTLVNNGTIINEGVIGTSGTIINNGTIRGGTINNLGTLINCGDIDSEITGNDPVTEPCTS